MDWNGIIGEVISGTLLLVIGGVGGWFIGLVKGEKKSSTAIERKNEIYQPLLDEVKAYSKNNWDILDDIETHFLKEIATNSYKYGLSEEIQNKCNHLYNVISEYNRINPIRVANSIIIDIFEKGYEEIYGSIIDGVSYHTDRDGNEWEQEELVQPVQIINEMDCKKLIRNLLYNEGMYSDEICIDAEHALYEPIYLQLKSIYASALNVIINGIKHQNPKPKIEIEMLPEEYIAYYYDFFELYNNNAKIKDKYELRKEIMQTSQDIGKNLKELIAKIVKIYEIEKI